MRLQQSARGGRGGGSGRGRNPRPPAPPVTPVLPPAPSTSATRKRHPKNVSMEAEAPAEPATRAKKSARQNTAPIAVPKAPRTVLPTAASTSVRAPTRGKKRSNGAVIMHHLQQMGEFPQNEPPAASTSIASRQVHYASLPQALRDENALKSLLTPFGKIVNVDMNYAGRGALVTFSNAHAATNAMNGAMLANGKTLVGIHPVDVKVQKGRNFTQPAPMGIFAPSLGRHNMDDAEDEEPAPTTGKMARQRADQQDAAQTNSARKKRAPMIPDEDPASDENEEQDEDDTNMATTSKMTQQQARKQAQKLRNMQSPLLPTPVLAKARSMTAKWVASPSTKSVPTTFGKFGTTSSAMDVDESTFEEDQDEEVADAPKKQSFSTYDPTAKVAKLTALEPGIIETAAREGATHGRPQPFSSDMVRKISSKLKEAQEEEAAHDDEEEEDGEEEHESDEAPAPSTKRSGGGLFSKIGTFNKDEHDWSDAEEGDGEDVEEEAHETEADEDDEDEEAGDTSAMEEDEDVEGEGESQADSGEDDEEDAQMDDEAPSPVRAPPAPVRSLPLPKAPLVAPKRIAPPATFAAKKRAPIGAFSGTIDSLARSLNPLENPGCLNALYDTGKHIWHGQIEKQDPARAVSSFQRPAGGDDIPPPERVRPVKMLYLALNQVEENGLDALADGSATRLEISNYQLNRYRQILKELTQQSSMCLLSCYIAETIARRALAMKAELMMEDGEEPDESFDTGREKVLENAFEMCKNIYTFYMRYNMRSPFTSEILSYYLLYRLRDGPKTYWSSILDSLASVYSIPSHFSSNLANAQENAANSETYATRFSEFMAEIRFDPNFDFVCQVVEQMDANNWSALRILAKKHASFLQLCALADLMPKFVYYTLPFCFAAFKDGTGKKIALPASYLQYHFFLKGDTVIERLLEMGCGDGLDFADGTKLEIPDSVVDEFYPLPNRKRGLKSPRSTSSYAHYLPPDAPFWNEKGDQIEKLLATLPPTFLYYPHASKPIDPLNALNVYQRWASQDLFQQENRNNNDAEDLWDAALQSIPDDMLERPPASNLETYIIPTDTSRVSSIYERAIERSLARQGIHPSKPSKPTQSSANTTSSSKEAIPVPAISVAGARKTALAIPSVIAAKPKVAPPPPPNKKTTAALAIPENGAAIQANTTALASAPKISLSQLSSLPSASTAAPTSISSATSAATTPAAPQPAPMVKKAGVSIAKSAGVPVAPSAPISGTATQQFVDSQIQLIRDQLQAQMKQQQEELAKSFAEKEAKMLGQIESLRSVERELLQYAQKNQGRDTYQQPHEQFQEETDVSHHLPSTRYSSTPSSVTNRHHRRFAKPEEEEIFSSPLEIPSLVAPHVASRSAHSLINATSKLPALLTFKLLVHLGDDEPASNSPEQWIRSKLQYSSTSSSASSSASNMTHSATDATLDECHPHITNLTCAKSHIDLSPHNPYNAGHDWMNELSRATTTQPLLATVIKRICTAQVQAEDFSQLSAYLRGTQGLLFYLPPFSPSSTRALNTQVPQTLEQFWSYHRDRLQRTLYFLSSAHRIPLMILYGPGNFEGVPESDEREAIQTMLGLSEALQEKCSHALVLKFLGENDQDITGTNGSASAPLSLRSILGQARATEQLEHIISSFAMLSPPNPDISSCHLSDLLQWPLEDVISTSYTQYRKTIEDSKSTPSSTLENLPDPSSFVQAWNAVMNHTSEMVRDESLTGFDWPAPETFSLFPHLMSSLNWPHPSWNTLSQFEHLKEGIYSFTLRDVTFEPEALNLEGDSLASIVSYVSELIGTNEKLNGFQEQAEFVVSQFKDRLNAGKHVSKRTGRVPVPIPFPWHSLFELVFAYLLEQFASVEVGLQANQVPTRQALLEAKHKRRNRQLSESDTWISWYQSLCPTVEEEKRKEQKLHSAKLDSEFESALRQQFAPVTAPVDQELEHAREVQTNHQGELQLQQANMQRAFAFSSAPSTPYQPKSNPSDPGSKKNSQHSPISLGNSSATPTRLPSQQTASALLSPAAPAPSPSTSVDSLHERLKLLQTRLSAITASDGPRDNASVATKAKRKTKATGPSSSTVEPPTPKRRVD